MPRQRKQIAVWIERKDYDAFKAICHDDLNFPNTFDELPQRAMEQITKAEARGDIVNKVIMDPQEFAAFCRAGRIDTNSTTLDAYAGALTRKRKQT